MTTTITASWDAVTVNVDGEPLSNPIEQYEVQYYVGDTPAAGTQEPVFVSGGQTFAVITGVPNGNMGVRVRAIDNQDISGPWTPYITQDTGSTPPGRPANFTADFTSN